MLEPLLSSEAQAQAKPIKNSISAFAAFHGKYQCLNKSTLTCQPSSRANASNVAQSLRLWAIASLRFMSFSLFNGTVHNDLADFIFVHPLL
jgi:hypothetical protein